MPSSVSIILVYLCVLQALMFGTTLTQKRLHLVTLSAYSKSMGFYIGNIT